MKIVRDIAHGYIDLTDDDLIFIDSPEFQRLRRIRQTTTEIVYPNSHHSRFEHSLGVMHLGKEVFEGIKSKHSEFDSEVFENTVKYACLLHDLGHTPFSHALEFLYPVQNLEDIFQEYDVSIKDYSDAANHEQISCVMSLKRFSTQLEHMNVDLELFCRMILGSKYTDGSNKNLNPLIEILNSHIDVDKLDYLIRDNILTGIDMISLDRERIIKSSHLRQFSRFYLFSSGKPCPLGHG